MPGNSTLAAEQSKAKAAGKKNEAATASQQPKDSAKSKTSKDQKKSLQEQRDSGRLKERGQPSTDKLKAHAKSPKTNRQKQGQEDKDDAWAGFSVYGGTSSGKKRTSKARDRHVTLTFSRQDKVTVGQAYFKVAETRLNIDFKVVDTAKSYGF